MGIPIEEMPKTDLVNAVKSLAKHYEELRAPIFKRNATNEEANDVVQRMLGKDIGALDEIEARSLLWTLQRSVEDMLRPEVSQARAEYRVHLLKQGKI